VGPLADQLGVSHWLATEYGVNERGILSQITRIVDGYVKRGESQALQESEGASRVVVYTDSVEDLPLLRWAEGAILLHPDHQLLMSWRQSGWIVVSRYFSSSSSTLSRKYADGKAYRLIRR